MSKYKSFRVEMFQDVTIVTLQVTNLWDRAEIQGLRDELLAYVRAEKPMKLVLDMSSAMHFSSETITTLMKLRDQMVGRDAQLRLCGLQPAAKEALKITELTRLFQIYDSLPEAFRDFAAED